MSAPKPDAVAWRLTPGYRAASTDQEEWSIWTNSLTNSCTTAVSGDLDVDGWLGPEDQVPAVIFCPGRRLRFNRGGDATDSQGCRGDKLHRVGIQQG